MVNDNAVISEWLTVPDLVERTGADLRTVRRWLDDRELIGVRRGDRKVLMVPATFLQDGLPLPALRGTLTVLADSGMTDTEIVDWLHASDDTLQGGSAIASLHAGAKTEVRRRAQEEAF